MRLSLYLNPQTLAPETDLAQIDLSIEQALRATEAGFDGVAMTEHHVSGYNTFGDNMMMAAYLAPQVRSGTRLSLAIVVPQLHHPIRLAQQCNLLDIMCRGEVIIGMGAGGSPVEFFALGRNPQNRHPEMMEVIEVVEAALAKKASDPHYNWETTYDRGFLSTRIMPASFDGGPKFARAAQSDESVIWTAQRGWYLMTARAPVEVILDRMALYRKELEKTSLNQTQKDELIEWSSLTRQVVIAQSDKEAEVEARIIIERLAQGVRRSWSAPRPDGQGSPSFTREVLGVSAEDPEAFIKGAMIVGSPDTVLAKLEQCKAGGINHTQLCFNYGHMTREQANRQLDLFIEEVMPKLSSRQQHKVPANRHVAAAE
ncbi:LLM class flavin-dependent oxidoreductase [Roseibium sp. M-1]